MTQPTTQPSPVYHRGQAAGYAIQQGLLEGCAQHYNKALFDSDPDYIEGLFIGRAQRLEEHLFTQLRNPAAKASLSTRDATITAISQQGRALTLSLHRHTDDPNTFDFELRASGKVAAASFFDTSDLSLHQGSMAVAAQMLLTECCEYAQMLSCPDAYSADELATSLYQLYPAEHQHVLATLAGEHGTSELVALFTALEQVDWTTEPAVRLA